MKAHLTKIINCCNALIQATILVNQGILRNGKLNDGNVFDPFKLRPAFVTQKINGQSIMNVPKSKSNQW